MFIFERDFFSLVVKFADKIQRKHTLSYNKVLFAYTPIYVRLLGFADEQSISEINPKWQSILKQLPRRDNRLIFFIDNTCNMNIVKLKQPNNGSVVFDIITMKKIIRTSYIFVRVI